jgi:hypothetical protein
MKPYFHNRTLVTQLTHCHLISVSFDCRLKGLPKLCIISAGLGPSLYSLEEDRRENNVSIAIA